MFWWDERFLPHAGFRLSYVYVHLGSGELISKEFSDPRCNPIDKPHTSSLLHSFTANAELR